MNEEKERYAWGNHYILDTETKEQLGYEEIFDLLNQQDKEIKKLKKELSKYKSYKTTDEQIRDLENLYSDYKKENLQLKQSQKQLGIDVLKKLKELCKTNWIISGWLPIKVLQEEIDNQIKQLEVQNEV